MKHVATIVCKHAWYDTAVPSKFTESIRALAAPFTAEPTPTDALNKKNHFVTNCMCIHACTHLAIDLFRF